MPRLLGWEVASWPPARRKELEVALHAGALVALAPSLWRLRPDARTLALSLAPPVVAGLRCSSGRSRSASAARRALGGGLLLGAAALARGRPRRAATKPPGGLATSRLRDVALALGFAQAAALVARRVADRARRWPRRGRSGTRAPEASRLSFGVAGPVLAGATALKAWRGRHAADRALLAAGAVAAFAGTRAALRVVGLERREPLWPYAAERALLAAVLAALPDALRGAVTVVRYRRAR